MPDFQQFAERCSENAEEIRAEWFTNSRIISDTMSPEYGDWKKAERHARLLQQIWEWAESPADPLPAGHVYAVIQGGTQVGELAFAKAHVRSLLVGQQENK